MRFKLKPHLPVLLLGGILLLAGLLRFYKIEERCLFGDGVITVNIISQSSVREIWNEVTQVYRGDQPLYYILLHYWSLLSKSIFWLRALSAICGSLLVFVAYKLANYLFGKKAGLLTAYFVAISPLLVLYSQTVRYYSISSLFKLLALYFFIKAVRDGRRRSWASYIAATLFSLYLNYSAILYLLPKGIFILIYRKKYALSLKRWGVSLLIIGIMYIPMLVYLLRDLGVLTSGEGFSRIPFKAGYVINWLYFFFAFSLGKTVSPFNYPAVLIAACVYIFILIRFFRAFLANKISRESINFILIVLISVTVLCALSNYNSPRYIKSASVLFAMIVSLGILNMPKKMAVLLVVLVTGLRLYSLHNLYTEQQFHKKEFVDDWDDIAEFTNKHSGPRDVILYNSISFGFYMEKIKGRKKLLALPGSEEEMRQLISEQIKNKNVPAVVLVDSPLSGTQIEFYEQGLDYLRYWLKKNNFKLVIAQPFDRDKRAELKRNFLDRPFPEYRTTVYIYSKVKDAHD